MTPIVVVLDAVDAARLRPRAQRFGARLHVDVARLRHRGHHHVLGHVADIRQVFARLPLACNDDRARVRNAGGEPQQHRRVKPFAQLVGLHRVAETFGRVGRLEHRHLGGDGVMARVLLVLGGMHPRVVRDGADHAAVDADVGGGVQRVRRHVQADVLHRAKAACAAERGAERHLKGDLFVGRPFGINFVVFGDRLGDFRARGAGVGGDHRHAGFV